MGKGEEVQMEGGRNSERVGKRLNQNLSSPAPPPQLPMVHIGWALPELFLSSGSQGLP